MGSLTDTTPQGVSHVACVAGAKQSAGGLEVSVTWADGVPHLLPHEVLKRHVTTANALLDFMMARVRSKRDVGRRTANARTK